MASPFIFCWLELFGKANEEANVGQKKKKPAKKAPSINELKRANVILK
jgi:hypothetical protein